MASIWMSETQALKTITRRIAELTVMGELNVFQSVDDLKEAILAFDTLGHVKAAAVLRHHLDGIR